MKPSPLLLVLALLSPGVARAGAAPYHAIDREYASVPAGVMPWGPTWSPDGKHILFQDYNGKGEWLADADGGNVRCLTCDMADRPDIQTGFTYVFPDDKRMFMANELGDLAYVLECAPNVYACGSHKWLPIDLEGDANTAMQNLGRRTYHLAPDGVHVGYTITRLDGLVMMVAKLTRPSDDGYVMTDYKVVNPPSATSLLDTSAERWANGGTLNELKSFADGGRSILAVVEPTAGNVDQVKIDLATGKVTRLTADPDWDEDGALAPDSKSLLVASWRSMNRLSPFGLFEGSRSFITLPVGAAIAIHYVSSHYGFACDLQPWLLPAGGDAGGTLLGQPLNPYAGTGNTIGANDLSGQSVWSPDSTRVLLQERSMDPIPDGANDYLKQKGPAPSRLAIAHIKRKPTRQVGIVETEVGDWAPTPQEYRGTFGLPGTGTVNGRYGGTATITIGGNIAAGEFRAAYDDFSDDDPSFRVNGTTTSTGGPTTALSYSSHLTATDKRGATIGSEDIDVQFTDKRPDPPTGVVPSDISGSATATWGGVTASGVPDVEPCPDVLPRRPQLELRVRRHGRRLTARVTATIGGSIRPVSGAVVRVGRRRATTGRSGRVRLRARRRTVVRASAGDTFLPAHRP